MQHNNMRVLPTTTLGVTAAVFAALLASVSQFAAADKGVAPDRIELAGTTSVHVLPTFDDDGSDNVVSVDIQSIQTRLLGH